MSIKETQRNLIRSRLIKTELISGEFPSVDMIDKQMDTELADRTNGLPLFIHRPIVKGQTSDMKAYNAMLREIDEDLLVGFEEVKAINNQLMALTSYYESARTRVEQDLHRIEMKSEIVATRARSQANRDVVGDNFHNFTNIEFTADPSRNIPRTDAFVDLRHSEAVLNQVKNSTTKHDLSPAEVIIKTLTPDCRTATLSPIKNAFADQSDTGWRSVVTAPSADGVVMQMDITLPDPKFATNVSIDMQSGKPIMVTLLLSADGEYYTELETRKVYARQQWVYDRREVAYLRFRFHKIEEDIANGTDFDYIFAAKQIELKDDQYVKQAYLVSKPFPIHNHDAIDYIHLEAEEYRPPGTHIRYYVGLDYDNNLIEWQEIQPDTPIEMKMVQTRQLEIDPYTESYGDLLRTNFGQSFYSVGKLPFRPLPQSTRVQMGRNMWTKETISTNFLDGDDTIPPYQTGVQDWIRVPSSMKDYMNIDNYQDTLQANTFQRYTTFVFIDNSLGISETTGTVQVGADASYALYVNSNKAKSIDGSYKLSFRSGWNKVEVLTYSRKTGQEIIFNLYLREMSDKIYANNEPLVEVSLYDLLNNTSNRIYNRFAVDDDNRIIVNYDPRDLDIQRNGVEYSLSYRYSIAGVDRHQIRLMAILSKEGDDVTVSPRLKGYQLVIE
ncbi:hypothetical protein ACK8P5_26705 (plasmid) [Paenibacillus sp. EC2-1]|uniref:hypothetical protein n=1 Tax=Paenibacillus sp. EC2-1 TaxID=3388665 RepID=UPI003BEF399A